MRRLSRLSQSAPPLLPRDGARATRDANTLGATVSLGGTTGIASCLRCVDEPCMRFAATETGALGAVSPVCPTGAIADARRVEGPRISSECVECGLCAVRCPVGAISLGAGPPTVRIPRPSEPWLEEVTPQAFLANPPRAFAEATWSDVELRAMASRLTSRAAPLKQDAFYPLVASLFTAAGIPAWRPARGDTSNRIDLVLVHGGDAVPVEIKSPTEAGAANVKAVQQALENKIVLDTRAFFPARPDSSTLVVAYEYPPARSDVTELVSDILGAFGIRVGLVSLATLWRLVLRRLTGDEATAFETIRCLQGPL